MKFIIGKKIEMTQLWQGENVSAVTKIQAGPCYITQIKTQASDGYESAQIGFGAKKEKNTNKPQLGHLKKAKEKGVNDNFAFLREFSIDDQAKLDVGDRIEVGTFSAGDKVAVSGISRGKGFQGSVKRHGFSGGRKSHGNKDQLRMPGSTGATGAGHVFKGTRKPGRMGGDMVTTKNLEIAEVDQANNILYIKGAVPGARNSLVLIKAEGDLQISKPVVEQKAEIKNEEIQVPVAAGEIKNS
ncbi:MAG TPA: 50S ribosomal protein L3 [Candidatus Methylomirabilis sp.]|nr:50S ribosomal protein L3 [Candidatus Methylomirabilis sp.]